ncbi:MAG: RNA methyltransferase [Rhodocyclaceae bacterium]|jgi:TrmH family RNA methyltransferase|nr:RNA methyltransferase [Rhodocyclaceae bacterium]
MKTVTSRDNPKLKALRLLLADARKQRASGKSVLEGPHLVAAALDHGVLPDLVVVSESAVKNPEVLALIERAGQAETLCLPDALFRSLSELASPAGLLARIAIPAVPSAPSFEITGDCLLLDAVQDAGNVGTLLRTAAAAGVRDVLLGPGCAGAWTPRVLRAAQGAHFGLRLREQVDLAAFLKGYPGLSIATVAREGEPLYALDLTRPVAWLFGNEGQGLSAGLVARALRRATIPLAPDCESLNVAAAAAICLFEMRRQREFR